MVELTNCKLTIDKRWRKGTSSTDWSDREFYILVVEIPLPGGKAIYEHEISKEQYNNMLAAHKLSHVEN